MTVADRLRALRAEKGITQEALAIDLRVSKNTVYYWERGTASPSLILASELARYYGVSLDWLVGLAEERKPPA